MRFSTQEQCMRKICTIGALLLLVPVLLPVRAAAQQAEIDPEITSSGGELQEGTYGELYSTIGEPLASDSIDVSASSDEATWIGFWHVMPADTTSGIREEWAPFGLGSSRIASVHPNPFEYEVTVNVRLETPGVVRLAVHDLLGREVLTLVEGPREAGTTRVRWAPVNVDAGTYVLRLEIDGLPQATATVQYLR